MFRPFVVRWGRRGPFARVTAGAVRHRWQWIRVVTGLSCVRAFDVISVLAELCNVNQLSVISLSIEQTWSSGINSYTQMLVCAILPFSNVVV